MFYRYISHRTLECQEVFHPIITS